jgi:oligopeptide/dipeptide ABC transporter ATP-binding protein
MRQIRGQQIGFVAQNPFDVLNPVIPIRRQFFNALNAHGHISKDQARSRSLAMLAAAGLPGPQRVLEGYAHELSGGMAQRVVISLALINEPQLLIADEPTTALDVTVQHQILDTLRALITGSTRSMLLVTHDLGVVAQYCDRVVVLYAGKVVEAGPVKDVFGQPSHPYTLALMNAVPRPGKDPVALTGALPDLISYPEGCPFKYRCSLRHSTCEDTEPLLSMWNDHRWRACHMDVEAVGR